MSLLNPQPTYKSNLPSHHMHCEEDRVTREELDRTLNKGNKLIIIKINFLSGLFVVTALKFKTSQRKVGRLDTVVLHNVT